MDLVVIEPQFNFSDLRTGHAINSMISPGAIISGAMVEKSVVGYNTRVHSFSQVNESVVMNNLVIGRGSSYIG